ncbi:hypothetical protein ABH905_002264 [Pseudomonas frederiksbergensis]
MVYANALVDNPLALESQCHTSLLARTFQYEGHS